ncbi:PTS mannose/fructose/sorbose/N-acetylgalactosamine transporter subunit IIC [[Enterobacter] lignolyticus]|uniref:PTS N-acetylgalactosamine transporter subunit IIC n=1 Tax=[Enterobacter] lignolyticus TaxID=1334193 RepID=A0A806X1G0_9ENTR|nr:PTS sugar transporter subunit IIC [[Enterobacter] lignolyticus]ALR75020.1 PTS N-acetylgalactosamine transporter subunit IIC [[Enterobacter] lignolyticus]
MELTTVLLVALVAAFTGADSFAEQFQTYRPIVVGFLIGLVLGDVKTGLMVGAILELVFLGQTAAFGGAQPPNMVIGTVIGVTFTIVSGLDPKVSVALAVPFAILMQAIMTAFCTFLAVYMHKNDRYIETMNLSGFGRTQWTGLGLAFVLYFTVAFIPIYFGAEQASGFIKSLPEFVIHGLSVAGGILPAVGFAMLLKMMWKRQHILFLIGGFAAVSYLKMPILALAIFGACFAAYDFFSHQYRQQTMAKAVPETEEEGI